MSPLEIASARNRLYWSLIGAVAAHNGRGEHLCITVADVPPGLIVRFEQNESAVKAALPRALDGGYANAASLLRAVLEGQAADSVTQNARLTENTARGV